MSAQLTLFLSRCLHRTIYFKLGITANSDPDIITFNRHHHFTTRFRRKTNAFFLSDARLCRPEMTYLGEKEPRIKSVCKNALVWGFWNGRGGGEFCNNVREIKCYLNIWGIRKKREKGTQKKGGENSPISPPLDPRLHSCDGLPLAVTIVRLQLQKQKIQKLK